MNKVEGACIVDLSNEILVNIFDKLPSAEGRGRARQVCKLFKRVLGDASFEPYWKGQFQEKFSAYAVQMNGYSPWQKGFREFANAEKKRSAELSDEVKRAIETVKRSHDQWIINPKEPREAFSILRRYEDGGGNAEVYYNLALCYAFQIGVGDLAEEKRMKCARINCKKAADLGHAKGCFRTASEYMEERNYDEALRYFKLAAEHGCLDPIRLLALCFVNKFSPEPFRMTLEVGDHVIIEMFNDWISAMVEGGGVSDIEGLSYLKLLADQGYVVHQIFLAGCYINGFGVEANKKEAVRYFKLASKQGHKVAINCLATLNSKGK